MPCVLNMKQCPGERPRAANCEGPDEMVDEFSDYDRRHPFEREFTLMLRRHVGADPDQLARACIATVFDHLLNPPELDHAEGPLEEEARQVEAKLIGLIYDEASAVIVPIPHRGSRQRPVRRYAA